MGFPSSQSSITDDSARIYLFAVEDVCIEAVRRACRQFVRGEVKGRNNSFAPSAAELSELCRSLNSAIIVERFRAANLFVEQGSEAWAKLLIHRGKASLPTFEKDGRAGWYFTTEEVNAAAPIMLPKPVESERLTDFKAMYSEKPRFTAGDPDGDDEGDMGDTR